MRRGYGTTLRRRVQGPQNHGQLVTELLTLGVGEDVRATADQLTAGTRVNVEVWNEQGLGAARLESANVAAIASASGSDVYTDITSAYPRHILLWKVDPTVGPGAVLATFTQRLTRRRVGGNAPFDGVFVCTVSSLTAVTSDPETVSSIYQIHRVADAIPVQAKAMGADTTDVVFTFGASTSSTTPGPLHLDYLRFSPRKGGTQVVKDVGPVPVHRYVVFTIEAQGGTNTNYGLIYDSGAANSVAAANVGTVYHRLGAFSTDQFSKITSGSSTGMWRFSIALGQYDATGTITFTNIDLGGAPTGTVRFVVRGAANGGTLLAEVSDDAGANWFTVLDGYRAVTDLPSVASQQTYQMRATFTSSANFDSSPTLNELGVRDETETDLSPIATWESVDEEVDPKSGQGGVPEAVLRLDLAGQRDYRGLERILSETNLTDIQVRCSLWHPDIARAERLELDRWDVDDYDLSKTSAVLTLVGVSNRVKGNYPSTSGLLTALFLKTTTSDLSTGADFTKQVSPVVQATTAVVTVAVAASTTEVSHGYSPSGQPGYVRWPAGTWTVKLPIVSGNANVSAKIRVARTTSSGTVIEFNRAVATLTDGSEAYTELLACATGTTLSFALAGTEWTVGAVTNRARVDYAFVNVTTSSQSVTFTAGSTNTEITAPWSMQTYRSPASYSAQTVQAVFADWLANKVALATRYIGDEPADNSTIIGKNVQDTDGLRELQRIAAMAGGTVICSQGRVSYRDLVAVRGLVVESIPREECEVVSVTHGFRARQPIYRIPFGYDGAKFAGEVQTEHTQALAAFGPSRVTAVDAQMEDQTAQWVTEPELAGRLGLWYVNGFACGMIRLSVRLTVCYPHLELCDMVAVETDQIAMPDPVTGTAIRGPVWAVGRIVARRGALNEEIDIWIPGPSNLFAVSYDGVAHQPYEPVTVRMIDQTPTNRLDVMSISFNVSVTGTTVYYYYRTASEGIPAYDSHLWNTYAGSAALVGLQRDTSAVKYLDFWGKAFNVRSAIQSVPVQPDVRATIGTLVASESGTTVTATASNYSANTREIRWYMRKHASDWPTGDGLVTGVLDETYFVNQKSVDADLGGSPSQAHTGAVYLVTEEAKIIAVPVDINNNRGVRASVDYTFTATASANLSATTWVTNTTTAGVLRTIDLAWTDNAAVADGTHDLKVYANDGTTRTLILTEASPATTNAATALSTGVITGTGSPTTLLVYEWDLVVTAGGAIVASGVFSPAVGDYFYTGDGSLET